MPERMFQVDCAVQVVVVFSLVGFVRTVTTVAIVMRELVPTTLYSWLFSMFDSDD